tara:strand:+ start:838 stop:1197 length:360 start_codon:yes stop_codon:yes gene_type:complete
MSEETPKPEKINYPVIPHDAIVTVEFSGFFINRIQNLLLGHCNAMSQEDVMKAFEEAKDLKSCSTIEKETVGILLCLVEAIENYALEQNKVENVELNAEQAAQMLEYITIRPPKLPSES